MRGSTVTDCLSFVVVLVLLWWQTERLNKDRLVTS